MSINNNPKNEHKPAPLKPTVSAKTPQPNSISLDVCGQRKTNFSHAEYFSSSVACTLSNSSSSSASWRWARLKPLGSRPAHSERCCDNNTRASTRSPQATRLVYGLFRAQKRRNPWSWTQARRSPPCRTQSSSNVVQNMREFVWSRRFGRSVFFSLAPMALSHFQRRNRDTKSRQGSNAEHNATPWRPRTVTAKHIDRRARIAAEREKETIPT